MTAHVDQTATIGAVVLAGGQARRLGGLDKGLIPLRGRPLATWVIERLRPQVGEIVLSANRHLAEYEALGCPVVSDRILGHAGPLAGIHAAASMLKSAWVLTAPCDTPFLPRDLAARMLEASRQLGCRALFAAEPQQPHFGIIFMNRALLDPLAAYLKAGNRKVGVWLKAVDAAPVTWPAGTNAFFNINTPDDLARAEALAGRLDRLP